MKPCPFCGTDVGDNLWRQPATGYCVACPKCDADGPFGETEEEAKERWDCRLDEPQSRDSDRIDKLEEVIERILTMIEKLHERQSKR